LNDIIINVDEIVRSSSIKREEYANKIRGYFNEKSVKTYLEIEEIKQKFL